MGALFVLQLSQMAHPGGAPTKATEATLEKARQYLNVWKSLGEAIPTVEGLAIYLGLHRDTLYARPEFSDTLLAIQQQAKYELQNGGLNGKFQPRFTQFMLAANHGMVEKTATDHTTNGKDLPTPIFGGGSMSVHTDDSDQANIQSA